MNNIETDSLAVNITASGRNVAGETYTLECTITTANVTGSIYNFMWLGPMNSTIYKSVPSRVVNMTGNMSTLIFDPLATSHAGNYTCVVAVLLEEDHVSVTSTLHVQIRSKLLN